MHLKNKNYKTIFKKPCIKRTNRYINSNLGVSYDVITGEISLVFDEMNLLYSNWEINSDQLCKLDLY